MGQEVLFRDSSKSCILAKNRLIWSILSLSLSSIYLYYCGWGGVESVERKGEKSAFFY